jgi:4-hydroxy-tetrahydrodipicolinate synthase
MERTVVTDKLPIRGVLPVIQTPFTSDGEIDSAVLRREIDWVLDQGCDGIVVAMVSEIIRLEADERRRLGELACEFTGGRGTVVLSVGAESDRSARRLARHAETAGADAVMAIPPALTRLDDRAMFGYFAGILDAVGLPVVVQDASGYLGASLSISVQTELLDASPERVYFKPESSPIGPTLQRLLDATGGRARVFEGTGGIALVDSHRRGIVGTMPAADVCWALKALWDALESGDEDRADAIAGPLTRLISFQSELDLFVAVEKYLLVKQGVFTAETVRGPSRFRWDEASRREIDHSFALLRRSVDTVDMAGDAR